ncbi:MAG: peroxiredoxin [Acidimicrobiales bacterium]
MVDFDTNAMLLGQEGIAVVAASVDSVERTASLAEGLYLRYVKLVADLDGPAVAAATGASLQTGDRTFLHATGFLLNPDGEIVNSVYSSGPIGRFTANDILKKVRFEKVMAERRAAES